jgi:hypothetical protein
VDRRERKGSMPQELMREAEEPLRQKGIIQPFYCHIVGRRLLKRSWNSNEHLLTGVQAGKSVDVSQVLVEVPPEDDMGASFYLVISLERSV